MVRTAKPIEDKKYTFKVYDSREADVILRRFRKRGINLSLDDVANSLDVRSEEGAINSPRDKRIAQAVFLADTIGSRGLLPEDKAYDISFEILLARNESDDNYLAMWDEVARHGINVDDHSVPAGSKAELLARLFPEKFARGGKQDLTGKGSGYIGTVFEGVYKGAIKRAQEYGLIDSPKK